MPRGIYKRRKNGKKQRASNEQTTTSPEFDFGYFHRTIEEQLEAFAEEKGDTYSLADVTQRHIELLANKIVRLQSGSSELVSQVREMVASAGLPKNSERKSAKKVHVRARDSGPLGRKYTVRTIPCKVCGKKIRNVDMGSHIKYDHKGKKLAKSRGPASYWASMTPEQRSEEMLRRVAVRQRNVRKAA